MKITAINYNHKTQNSKTKISFEKSSIGVIYHNLEPFNSKKEINALKTIIKKILKNEDIKEVSKQADCDIEFGITPNSFSGDMFYVGINKPHDFGLPMHDRKANIFNATEIVKNEKSIKEHAKSITDIIELHTGLKKPSSSEYMSEPWRRD